MLYALAASGWVVENGGWHYLDSSGNYVTDQFKRSGDNYFYLDSNGDMVYSSIIDDGKNFYYVNSAGAMVSNEWREGVYYSDPQNDGRLAVNSWAYITAEDPDNEEREGDGYWFFFDGSGKKVTDKVNKIINGRKYRFSEYGVANYDWYNGASSSSASYYYSTEEQCWLRTGWFKAYPDPDKDPEGYDMGDEYWYYADKKGKTAAMNSSTPLRSGLRPFHAHIQLLPGNDRISILYICSDNSIRIYCFKISFYRLSARQSRRCVCRSPPLILRPPAAPC